MSQQHMEEFTVEELIGLLSCFTDIRVRDEVRQATVPTSKKLQTSLSLLASLYQEYEDLEDEFQIRSGHDYKTPIVYDVVEDMMKWSQLDDEVACKTLLQALVLSDRGISAGDFSKAVLKICVIAKEWMSVCEEEGFVSLMHKLSMVAPRMLKYICTNQSLYV